MRDVVDVYPPFRMPALYLILIVSIVVLVVATRFGIRKLLQHLAIRRQQQAVADAQRKDPQLIDQAIRQLDSVHQAFRRKELSAAHAVEQASALVRETYDAVMNHRTRYQAQYEIASRRLEHLADLVYHAYPVEFADTVHAIPDEAVEQIFTKAKGVLESCR